MPFGAHETLEVHEILTEKKNAIEQFSFYAGMCRNPQLKSVIEHQLQSMIASYNQLVSYTHDYSAAFGGMQPYSAPQLRPQQIQYGLHQPMMQQVQMQMQMNGSFTDDQIASYALSCHKNGAKNQMQAALECADPNVRQMLMDGAVSCANQAYELFVLMNNQGTYQVPTMHDHTAKTYLHMYQPIQSSYPHA
ncbi:spore coat protein [Paenibacillus abyssi]|uniref:Coat protein F n=1 Tax=Paenibacillus abyssi TaxID=1340531 RepID=A0A917CZM4_9BACL|nr:spore coat protein [Paenibacillus abyssi]GGG04767.1 coat protein F [Paenibacillus abyssi]